MTLAYQCGDICGSKAEAVVNAANSNLLAGGGVCGAIFGAARSVGMYSTLSSECAQKAPCPTGSAVWTNAYGLVAKYIIHAVGPMWSGSPNVTNVLSQHECDQLDQLIDSYHAIFGVAAKLDVRSVAIPSISTGIYGLPVEFGAAIANGVCARYSSELDIELWGYSQAAVATLMQAPTSQVATVFAKYGIYP
jgi:O-acetyl-ADP-ribose deacetylase (regulator of RNase III)